MPLPLDTEILIFDTSEAYRAKKEIIINAIKIALEADGANSPAYFGLQIENPSTGYTFLHWDNYEIHKAFLDNPTAMATIRAAFTPCLQPGGKEVGYDVPFSGPTVALDKPVTELLVLSLKAPGNRDIVVGILTELAEMSGRTYVFGQTHQDGNTYVLLGGWQTVEEHWEIVAKPEFAAALAKLYSLTNTEHLHHTHLSRYWL